jgi:outer membrane protein
MTLLNTLTAVLVILAGSAPLAAQTPPAPKPPEQPAPAPPAAPKPARPLPEGAKYAFIIIENVVSQSAEGKAASARIEAFTKKKSAEIGEKQKLLQANQQKLLSSGTVMNDAAKAQLQKEVERQNLEIQRMQQDAQGELQTMNAELQRDFQQKLQPIIDALVKEKGLQILFNRTESGIIWADEALDLTGELVKRFDAAKKP